MTTFTLTPELHKAFGHLVEAALSAKDGWAQDVFPEQNLRALAMSGPKMRESLSMSANDPEDEVADRFVLGCRLRGYLDATAEGLFRLTHPTDGRIAYIYVSGDDLAVPVGAAFVRAFGGVGV